MKLKNIAVASAFITGNLVILSANAQNLITNGNFDSTTAGMAGQTSPGWTIGGNFVVNAIGANYQSGPGYAYGTGGSVSAGGAATSSGGATGTISQSITLSTAGTYTFSIAIKTLNSASQTTASSLGVTLGSNTLLATTAFTNLSYQTYTSSVTINSSGSYTLTVTNTTPTYTTPSTEWRLYIDDLSLILASAGGSSVDLAPNAYALRSVYNIQSAALNAGLSYDCAVFDKEGLCLSTGGRYSTTNSPETNTTSGLLIGSYKYDKNIRLGAWVDQNLSTQNPDGVKLSNNDPMFGVFGVWSERNDGLGYEVKVSAGYGDKDLTVTRSSANAGTSQLRMRGISTVSSFGLPVEGGLIAAPYVGFKYMSINRAGYTEGGSNALTYDGLHQESTTVVAGAKLSGKIDAETSFAVSAGVEHDLNHNVGQYSAGSSNTTVFNANVQKTRPVVSAGVYYDIDKTQRLGLNATVRQEAFQSVTSTSALATYTVGF